MDITEIVHGSTIRHGPQSNRIYLMHLASASVDTLVNDLDHLARQKGYTKIFAKIPAGQWPHFQRHGYVLEAQIPRLYNGAVDCFFTARYYSEKRQNDAPDVQLGKLLLGSTPATLVHSRRKGEQSPGQQIELCRPEEAADMSEVYRRVFSSYPFPIKDPSYIEQTMAENIRYFCVREHGLITSLASAEMDSGGQNAEMTDFATLPDRQGRGHAAALLCYMEKQVAKESIKTTYTIARAKSYGMNLVFKRCGYTYAGFLANNTNIAGNIQSMTVWYKHL